MSAVLSVPSCTRSMRRHRLPGGVFSTKIKLHIGLDQAGHLRASFSRSPARGRFQPAASWRTARILTSSGSISCSRGVTFVTRLKRGVRYRVTREHDIRPGTGVLSDQDELTSARTGRRMPRRCGEWPARIRDDQWVAQTLRIYTNRGGRSSCFSSPVLVGRSKNAVMTSRCACTCCWRT